MITKDIVRHYIINKLYIQQEFIIIQSKKYFQHLFSALFCLDTEGYRNKSFNTEGTHFLSHSFDPES